jgi:hypothetical protein
VIVIKKDKSKKKLRQMRTIGALQNGLPKPQEKRGRRKASKRGSMVEWLR